VRCDFARKVLFGTLVGEDTAELEDNSSPMRHGYRSSARRFSTKPAIRCQRSVFYLSAFNPALMVVAFK
jgi:hypothetical protein